MSYVRLAAISLALTVTHALAIEVLPSVNRSDVVFHGEVISVQTVQSLTNRSATAELQAARIKVGTVIKPDTKLGSEVTVYYVSDPSQLCPRCVDLTAKQEATFYCNRANIGGETNVLYLPMATFVVSQK